MENEHKPPTTVGEATYMVEALKPCRANWFTQDEKQLAYDRLIEFFEKLCDKSQPIWKLIVEKIVAPLDPKVDFYTEAEKELAFKRLVELIRALLSE